MDLTIHASFLLHADPDASLAFYRDTLGFEVRSVITDDERRAITEMMAEGNFRLPARL
jgi:catechol 2,3-dioxygenase-like lactoylglutathione lyase family enzyme